MDLAGQQLEVGVPDPGDVTAVGDPVVEGDPEVEAATPGLRPAGRLEVPPTGGYFGSTVVVLERP